MGILATLKGKLNEDFTKNILTVMGGSAVSVALPFLSSLWLVRLYDVAVDFTPFALFVSSCATLSALANSHYTTAIMVADTEEESVIVTRLTLLINVIVMVLAVLALLLVRKPLLNFLNASASFYYTVWLVPLTVLVMGINAAFTQWAYRFKQFKRIAANRAMQAMVTVVCQTFFGLWLKNIQGLIIGYVAGQLVSALVLAYRCMYNDRQLRKPVTLPQLKQQASKYKLFFRFQTPADVINVVTQQLPSFLLSKFAGQPTDLGYYGQAYRLIVAPSSIITGSVSDVFRQKAAHDYREAGNAKAIFLKTTKLLFLIMIIPCAAVAIFGPWIFKFLFGTQWMQAGVYAQILIIMMLPKFIASPLSYMYIIARKQVEDFYLHIYILISTFLSFYLGYKFYGTTIMMLTFFCINYAFIYGIYFFRSYKFSRNKNFANQCV
jgi:O-antigen/teichoic acid export membrane protein